ncbi:MAG: hypothetical protein ABW147_11300 [Candidatus Thiodiazotropha sp.]
MVLSGRRVRGGAQRLLTEQMLQMGVDHCVLIARGVLPMCLCPGKALLQFGMRDEPLIEPSA